MAKSVVSFVLDEEQDRDLLRWLQSLPKGARSEAIREALRAHLGRSGITLGDIYQAILDLKRGGLVLSAQGNDASASDEPLDVAATLDNLGL
jgi:Arc/MetJ-type ribon-helix-helix transcriptional regulator